MQAKTLPLVGYCLRFGLKLRGVYLGTMNQIWKTHPKQPVSCRKIISSDSGCVWVMRGWSMILWYCRIHDCLPKVILMNCSLFRRTLSAWSSLGNGSGCNRVIPSSARTKQLGRGGFFSSAGDFVIRDRCLIWPASMICWDVSSSSKESPLGLTVILQNKWGA